MSENSHGFLEWKEQFVSQERGNRVVHYFLKDSSGDSVLAVVGTERSLRHMVYVVAEEFLHVYGAEKSINANFKWRSRREVVDWLTSLLSKQHPLQDCSKLPTNGSAQALESHNFSMNGFDAPQTHISDYTGRFARRLKGDNSDIVWSGAAWNCGKQLKHYPSFCRNGTTIAVHSFVFVMAEEENHYLAYLEDMYEDKKGMKKVKVRWFHRNQEVKCVIRLSNQHPREVFITPYAQVISAECVDGPATVLTPEHYEKCLAAFPHMSSPRVHLCSRQFRGNRVKHFDLSKLRGYFNQAIFSYLDTSLVSIPKFFCNSLTGDEREEFSQGGKIKHSTKKTRSCRGRQRVGANHSVRDSGQWSQPTSEPSRHLKNGLSHGRTLSIKYIQPKPWQNLPFKVDDKIELLCQDSGIRGCWFRCTVFQTSRKQLKVQYHDVQNEDGCGNLEEWVPAFRLAAPDKLGMRCSGRFTIRPCPPPEDSTNHVFEVGSPVDAWWSDGWWEGVVTGVNNCGDCELQVYLPGEEVFMNFQKKNVRNSRDWVGNRWVDVEVKPDIASAICAAASPGTKLSTSSTMAKIAESGGSALSDREVPATSKLHTVAEVRPDLAVADGIFDGFEENIKLAGSRKRPSIEDEVKIGDGGEISEDDNNEDEDNDGNNDKLDIKEGTMASGQESEQVEAMEVLA